MENKKTTIDAPKCPECGCGKLVWERELLPGIPNSITRWEKCRLMPREDRFELILKCEECGERHRFTWDASEFEQVRNLIYVQGEEPVPVETRTADELLDNIPKDKRDEVAAQIRQMIRSLGEEASKQQR